MERNERKTAWIVVLLDLVTYIMLVKADDAVWFLEKFFDSKYTLDYSALFTGRISWVLGILIVSMFVHAIRGLFLPSGRIVDLSAFSGVALGIVAVSCMFKFDRICSADSGEMAISLYFFAVVSLLVLISVMTFAVNTMHLEWLLEMSEEEDYAE